jgi:hypothetical protein
MAWGRDSGVYFELPDLAPSARPWVVRAFRVASTAGATANHDSVWRCCPTVAVCSSSPLYQAMSAIVRCGAVPFLCQW